MEYLRPMHTKTPDTTDETLSQILQGAGVAYEIHYTGVTERPGFGAGDKPWPCDSWMASLRKGATIVQFNYYTGEGLRQYNTKTGKAPRGRRFTILVPRPVFPGPAGVLYALVPDASGAQETFSEWCDNFGADKDSISALKTYHACQETADKLRRVFNAETHHQIEEALEDY